MIQEENMMDINNSISTNDTNTLTNNKVNKDRKNRRPFIPGFNKLNPSAQNLSINESNTTFGGDRPRRSFGPRPEGSSFGDRPRRSFGPRPEGSSFGDRPRRSFGSERPARKSFEGAKPKTNNISKHTIRRKRI